MVSTSSNDNMRPVWLVGSAFGGYDDQTERFLQDGVWEGGPVEQWGNTIESIQPGDRIAMKSSYTRKNGLPFDNRGYSVSVMAIKATGVVVENLGDRRRLRVEWAPVDPAKEWYFYTNRRTVWKVESGSWTTDGLIAFTFDDQPQDLAAFRNDPYWRDRFGDLKGADSRFRWTEFYMETADRLLEYQGNRAPVVEQVVRIVQEHRLPFPVQDRFEDGSTGPLQDICPFTTTGMFNRAVRDETREAIASILAQFLHIEIDAPKSFDGIPTLMAQNSWYFNYSKDRDHGTIDILWQVFADAIALADCDDAEARVSFVNSYEAAMSLPGVARAKLTMGLFRTRPWFYPSLDGKSVSFIQDDFKILLSNFAPHSGTGYLALRDHLRKLFEDPDFRVHSFPELAAVSDGVIYPPGDESDERTSAPVIYTYADIFAEGCFLGRPILETMLQRLQTKQNLILQGPPGTGKTWLAKKLAYALIGRKDDHRVRPMQFHPNLSYEDFVRGWRPQGNGQLALVDGPFLQVVEDARKNPDNDYVMVIEEINRGNPASIFGEMLTLLEADKRNADEALALAYPREIRERVHIPPNVYVIGTMNLADRSLAMVDLALRRRFAFFDLEPMLNETWRDWVHTECGVPSDFLEDIARRIDSLNGEIAGDRSLGRQFRIGHSFVTPAAGASIGDPQEWFTQVVETEIVPLLHEYWFDDPDRVADARSKLLNAL